MSDDTKITRHHLSNDSVKTFHISHSEPSLSKVFLHIENNSYSRRRSTSLQALTLYTSSEEKLLHNKGTLQKFKNDLCSTNTNFPVSSIRWYILAVFSVYVVQQYFIWNTFGPISTSVKKAFDWDNGDIAMLANWDIILFVLLSMQQGWLIQRIGFRKCFLTSLLFIFVGACIRCTTSDSYYAKWTMNLGQLSNGLGGMMAQVAGPIISNQWFPPSERTTATSISSLSCQLGIALSFIIGPLVVPNLSLDDVEQQHTNISVHNTQMESKAYMKLKIQHLMYGELSVATLVLLVVFIYFPEKPKLPPSHSASLPKVNFFTSFKTLLKKKSFWLLLLVASSVTGVYSGWNAVLAVNFIGNGFELTQAACGWIGFASTMFSVFGGIFVGYLSDRYPGNIRAILSLLYFTATLMFLWISLICINVASFNLVSIYTSCLIGGFCINGSVPLLYELMIEQTYPVPEAVSIAFLGLVNNVFTFFFLLLLHLPSIGVTWMNWCLSITCGISVLLLFLVKEEYGRMNVDQCIGSPNKNDGFKIKDVP